MDEAYIPPGTTRAPTVPKTLLVLVGMRDFQISLCMLEIASFHGMVVELYPKASETE